MASLAALIASVAAFNSYAATPIVSANSSVAAGEAYTPVLGSAGESNLGPEALSLAIVKAGDTANATGYGKARFGSLKTYAAASASSGTRYGDAVIGHATSQAGFTDTMTISAGTGLAGAQGIAQVWLDWEFRGTLILDSHLNATVGHQINFRAGSLFSQVNVSGSAAGLYSQHCTLLGNEPEVCESTGYLGMQQTLLSIPFTVGTPFDISITQITQVDGVASPVSTSSGFEAGYFSAEADATHSTYWGGIQSVLINGQKTSFSLASASGTDWEASFVPLQVPEPSSVTLLVSGLLMMLLIGRGKFAV